MKKIVSSASLMLAGVAALAITASPPAMAVGGNCTASQDRQVVDNLPDKWRPKAKCSSLQADSKARGKMKQSVNHTTPWFTGLNKWYYGSYSTYVGPGTPTATAQIAHI